MHRSSLALGKEVSVSVFATTNVFFVSDRTLSLSVNLLSIDYKLELRHPVTDYF